MSKIKDPAGPNTKWAKIMINTYTAYNYALDSWTSCAGKFFLAVKKYKPAEFLKIIKDNNINQTILLWSNNPSTKDLEIMLLALEKVKDNINLPIEFIYIPTHLMQFCYRYLAVKNSALERSNYMYAPKRKEIKEKYEKINTMVENFLNYEMFGQIDVYQFCKV